MPIKWTRPSAVAKAMADKKKAEKRAEACRSDASSEGKPAPENKGKGRKPAAAKAMAVESGNGERRSVEKRSSCLGAVAFSRPKNTTPVLR